MFRRHSGAARLPADVVLRMERFGRFEFDPMGTDFDAASIWTDLQAPLLEFAQSDPERFTVLLAEAVLPQGGFALFGASRTIWNLIGSDYRHPAYDTVRMAALEFFRANGVPNSRLAANDLRFWQENRDEPWLVGRPCPTPAEARIVPLARGEVRQVARITAGPDVNAVYVQTDSAGGYQAVVEARRSESDPTRCRYDWFRALTLYDLYVRIGEAFQVPTHWVAEELAPFIPLPSPNF